MSCNTLSTLQHKLDDVRFLEKTAGKTEHTEQQKLALKSGIRDSMIETIALPAVIGGLAVALAAPVMGVVLGMGAAGPVAGGMFAGWQAAAAGGVAGGGLSTGGVAAAMQGAIMSGASMTSIAAGTATGAGIGLASSNGSASHASSANGAENGGAKSRL
jgi:hypothetical protein